MIDNDMRESPSLSVVEPQFDVTLDHNNSPAVDKEVREVLVDHMADSIVKEKPVKITSTVLRGTGETIHPLFISCLLDKVRRMEDRMNEIVASRDLMKTDNVELRAKVDESGQQLLRLKNHKNKLIRRVLKL